MANAAYPIIHRDPYSLVIGPSTVATTLGGGTGAEWIASYLAAGAAGSIDAISFHGYISSKTQQNPPETVAGLAQEYAPVLAQYGIEQLLDTEACWGAVAQSTLDLHEKAAWLARFYAVQAGLYGSQHLTLVSWFTWGDRTSTQGGEGVIENDDGTPNEAGVAFDQVASWLVGTAVAPCVETGTIWTCDVVQASGLPALVVWDAGATCSGGTCTATPYAVTGSSYLDLAGGSHAVVGGNAPIGLEPIFVR